MRFPGLLVLALLTQESTTAGELVPVRPVKGELRVCRAGSAKAEPVREELRVAPADRLGVPKGGSALFATEGDALIHLRGVDAAPDKGLSLERAGKTLVLKVLEGRLVVESFQADLQVETPHGRASASKAYFLVDVGEKSTRVVAIEGRIAFTTSMGTVTLEGGQESTAGRGQEPSAPKAAPPGEGSDFDAGGNLLKNPGFESSLQYWQSKPVLNAKISEIDSAVFHGGGRSMRFELANRLHGGKAPPKYLGFRQDVKLVAGRRYLLRGFARTETKEGKVTPSLVLDGGRVEERNSSAPSCEGTWKMRRVIATAEQENCTFSLEWKADADPVDAKMWWDDLCLIELPGPAPGR